MGERVAMKRLLIVSDESILGGVTKCGVAQVVDSLASSLASEYEVSVLCPDGNSNYLRTATNLTSISSTLRTGKIFGVRYYLLAKASWAVENIAEVTNSLDPDILHNFSFPELISCLTDVQPRTILSFDHYSLLEDKEIYLGYYDAITTFSESYAKSVAENYVPKTRARSVFQIQGVSTGLLTSVITPTKGLFLASKYDIGDLRGRQACRDKLHKTYGIPDNVCVYAMMCRLAEEKGIDSVLSVVHDIRDSGGILLIVGRGDKKYEDALGKLTRKDGVLWLKKWATPFQAAPFMAGADFFLQPSLYESCGLMPMTAAQYGAIPIVTDIVGFNENFNDDNAIMIRNGDLRGALQDASRLFRRKAELLEKRKTCMQCDFGWNTRKQGYIDLYEA